MQQKKLVFCTIITGNYFPFVLALRESLTAINSNVSLVVLISDSRSDEPLHFSASLPADVSILYYDTLCREGHGKKNLDKYHRQHHDAFRWAMKPVLLRHLLESHERVIYVDSDIHFYADYLFLFDLMKACGVLLSPHFRSIDPAVDYENYIMQFNNGIYNGGFIGASRKGLKAIEWWAKVCSEICEINPPKGQFVDQSHLNLLPVYFEGVHILQHRGCNIANWNQVECRRTAAQDSVMINGHYPIVFVHFTRSTIRGIMSGEDQLLRPFLDTYLGRLRHYGITLDRLLPPPVKTPLLGKLRFSHFRKFLRHRLFYRILLAN